MNFRKNLYFSCKHCGRDSYIDDTKFAFDDFGNGNLNGNQTEIALKCDFCQIRWAQRERLNAKKEIRNLWNERNRLQGKNRTLISKLARNIRIFNKGIKEYRLWLKEIQSYNKGV